MSVGHQISAKKVRNYGQSELQPEAASKQSLLLQQQQALETGQPGNVPMSKLDHTTQIKKYVGKTIIRVIYIFYQCIMWYFISLYSSYHK